MLIQKLKNLGLYLILFLFTSNSYAYAPEVIDFANTHGISNSNSERILTSAAVIIRLTQKGIMDIANDDFRYIEKTRPNGIIDTLIENNFTSPYAKVHVSSLNKRITDTVKYDVKVYLNHLALLTKKNTTMSN